MSTESLAQRLEDLEVRFAYQERTIEVLDDLVRELYEKVGALERHLEEMKQHLVDPPGEEAPLEEQVPPHY